MQQIKKYIVKQISTPCLSQYTYMILSNKEAAIIDPLRQADGYLDLLKEHDAKLKYVFLTHIHADFVAGHIPLARKLSSQIVMGPGAKVDFQCYLGRPNELFKLGDVNLKLLHTPGHTLESSCFLLQQDGKDQMVFTGDTLFLGDVGRPDLGVTSNISPEHLSGLMFSSLKQLKELSNDVIIYPGHGVGSPCGKNIQKGDFCTIGNQKESNCFFKNNDREDFIKKMVELTSPFPNYFLRDVAMNKMDHTEGSEDVLKSCNKPLSTQDILSLQEKEKVLILDTRPTPDFKEKHIKESISIPLIFNNYALFAGMLYKNEKIVIVSKKGDEEESIIRLTRVGLDNIAGFLKEGIKGWSDDFESLEHISPQEFESLLQIEEPNILDVRYPSEFKDGHVKNAQNFNVTDLAETSQKLNKDKTYYVYCRSGVRSVIAQSFLAKEGFKVINVNEGFIGISATSISISK
jgi:hydroxyacylglutathione hydrolase